MDITVDTAGVTDIAVRLLAGFGGGLLAAPLLAVLAARLSDGKPSRGRRLLLAAAAAGTGTAAALLPPAWILAGLPLFVLGLAAAIIDATDHRLPNLLTYTLVITGGAALGVLAWTSGHPELWIRALLGAAAYTALLLTQFLLSPSTGAGDVKYAAGLGLYLGAAGSSWWFAGVLGCYLIGLLAAALGIALRRWTLRSSRIPLGPAMYAGTVLAITAAAVTTTVSPP